MTNDMDASSETHLSPGMAPYSSTSTFSSWLWKSPKDLAATEMQLLLSYAQSKNISTIYADIDPYVHISAILDPATRQQQIDAFNASINFFITIAKDYNVNVQGLAGDTSWANNTNDYIPPLLVDYVLNYNKQHPTAQFDGIHFDIEFYNLSDFSTRMAEYSTNYLNTVTNLATQINADSGDINANFKLGFAVPFWFDENGSIPAFTYNGQTKHLAYHILDVLNILKSKGGQMVVMAYRNYADGTDGSIAISRHELAYAEANTKNASVIIGQETAQADPAKVTFYGLGKVVLDREVAKINGAYQGYSTYTGIAIHHLISYRDL